MENLFEQAAANNRKAPLAERMRPKNLEEFEDQQEILGLGKPLRQAIESDSLGSIILYGPPGTGKTTLARIIARMTRSHFDTINAVMAGVSDIRKVMQEARDRRAFYGEGTILFIDEIHRFNKGQQDALLPFVENGLIVLIGSTTENPLFTVNRPLLSRSRLFRLEPLSVKSIERILARALVDKEKGLGHYNTDFQDQALNYFATTANGDARTALNCLELAVISTQPGENAVRYISIDSAREACGGRILQYGQKDEHYDVISAFIKSMRGSDPQATVYWLARLIYAGEDPEFICRRIIIQAAEDVGLSDPRALMVAVAAAQAVERVGLPEARIIMAEAALYIAMAPKSNSVVAAINAAQKAVEDEIAMAVPEHLRDSSFARLEAIKGNIVQDYLYPHNYPGGHVNQQYLPDNLIDRIFFRPSAAGEEKDRADFINKEQGKK
ncbi:MAG: replication-associated recombination protein A [Peptococcaceae bacterium]|nr:replication-associated recombination protein A [Peptococcaceae bacterium]